MARMSSTRTAHHHQEYPEQGTDCSTGWFQRQSGCISRLLIWPSWLGQFSTGKKNDNGERMLELCTYHDLWITNTYFKTKPPLNVSWRQMRSEHWHQLGLILVSHDDLKNVLHTCSFHNANCNVDHSWRCCKVRLNVSKMRQLDLVEQFAEVFRKERDASKPGNSATLRWETLRTMHGTALSIFAKRPLKAHDWLEAK